MEFDFWVWLNGQKEHLAIIAGTLGAVAAIWKYLGRYFRDFVERIWYMFNAKAAHQDLTVKLDQIMNQLVPNGGSSIKDSLNRIEDKQEFFGSFLKAQMNVNAKALFEADKDGRWVWVNRPHSRLTGYQTSEVMGDGWINVVAPECRARVLEQWRRAVEGSREFDEDVWYVQTDGVTRYRVNVHAYIIQGRGGCVNGWIGEVTPRRETHVGPVECEQDRQVD